MKTNVANLLKTNLLKKLPVLSLAFAAAAPLCAMSGDGGDAAAAADAAVGGGGGGGAAAGAGGGGGGAAAAGAAAFNPLYGYYKTAEAARVAGYSNNDCDIFRARCAKGLQGVVAAMPDDTLTLQEVTMLRLQPDDISRFSFNITRPNFKNLERRVKYLYDMYGCNTPQDCLFAIVGQGYPAAAAAGPVAAAAVPGGAIELPTVMRLLVLAGAAVNAADRNGLTPLHAAAGFGRATVVTALLGALPDADARFAAVNARDNAGGNTPLHRAAKCGRGAVVTALLDALPADALLATLNAVVARGPHAGLTPLHLAARNGYAAVVTALLDALPAGARLAVVNARDNAGETSLHLAALYGHVEVVTALLNALPVGDRAAAVKAQDIDGWIPLQSARDHTQVAMLLRAAAAGAGAGADGGGAHAGAAAAVDDAAGAAAAAADDAAGTGAANAGFGCVVQ